MTSLSVSKVYLTLVSILYTLHDDGGSSSQTSFHIIFDGEDKERKHQMLYLHHPWKYVTVRAFRNITNGF
jgi:hypothetical protein